MRCSCLQRLTVLFLGLLPHLTGQEARVLTAQDVRIPLFASSSGERWGTLEIAQIWREAPQVGPFYLGVGSQLRAGGVSLRFAWWPEGPGWQDAAASIPAEWLATGSQLTQLRIECERHWALTLQQVTFATDPDAEEPEKTLRLRAVTAHLLTPDGITTFSNVTLQSSLTAHELLLFSPAAAPVRLALPARQP